MMAVTLLDPNVNKHILEKISVKKDHGFHQQFESVPMPISSQTSHLFRYLSFQQLKLTFCKRGHVVEKHTL